MEKIQKRIKVRGKFYSIYRELYLRDDVKCHSPVCKKCVSESGNLIREMMLDKNATHYAIPYYDIICSYLELLEIPELCGLIILQSIASQVCYSIGHRSYRRLINKVRDIRRGCAVFLNEVCKQTSIQRSPSESLDEWLITCTLATARYYRTHLKDSVPIIIVSNDPKMLEEARCNSLDALNLRTYLETMWIDMKYALELYDSISVASSLSSVKDPEKQYDSYLPLDVLESGIKSGQYQHGILHVNKHLPGQEAFVLYSKTYGKEGGDILISGMKDRNRAIHGDDVVVEIFPKSKWKSKSQSLVNDNEDNSLEGNEGSTHMPTGKVVGILDKKWRDYVASFPKEVENTDNVPKKNTERVLVIPYDRRIPKIRIATRQADKLKNERIIVRIDNWEKDSQYPNGHFVKALGEIGLLETDVLSLMTEHNISASDFPQYLLPELPKSTPGNLWTVDVDEVKKRKDLRQSHLIFSIDPKGCEDVDDALSVRKLPKGKFELSVHIADVTYFVPPFSLVDLEAQSRSTSVYLPDRRYDMLPHILSGELCSLLGNVDRYAVSVIWTLDSNFEVQDVWYGRTVICSTYKLCYEDAQDILFGATAKQMQVKIPEFQQLSEEELNDRFNNLKESLENLSLISNALRSKRLAGGGLELSSINMKFEIDKTLPSIITGFKQAEELDIHKVVAECMIFANQWVARKIYETFPQQAILRRHPNPREADLTELQKLVSAKGYALDIHSNKALSDSLEKAVDPEDPVVNQIFRILVTRTMTVATYCCSGSFFEADFYHYGLGLDRYTHFTSPIRRYADILVHRLLLASVGEMDDFSLLKMSELAAICNHMNEKHKAAQDIEKNADELFQAHFFSEMALKNGTSGCLVDGVIYSLKANGMIVLVPLYGLKGAVYLRNKDKKVAIVKDSVQWVDGSLEVQDIKIIVKTAECVQCYNVFQHITLCVVVQKTRAHQPKIVFELVRNEPYYPDQLQIKEEVDHHMKLSANRKEKEMQLDVVQEVAHKNMNSCENSDQVSDMYLLLRQLRWLSLLPAETLKS